MKKIFLIFAILFTITACDDRASDKNEQNESPEYIEYNNQIKKCDDEFNEKLKMPGGGTTFSLEINISEQIECHKLIANQIIDKSYSKQSESMKKNMNDYIKASRRAINDILTPDSCTPSCGTIVVILSGNEALGAVKKYLHLLMYGDPSWGEQ